MGVPRVGVGELAGGQAFALNSLLSPYDLDQGPTSADVNGLGTGIVPRTAHGPRPHHETH